MTINGLNFIAGKLKAADIPYCFEEWNKEIQYPYFVGEYTESEPMYENGESESTFILTGTTRGSWLELEKAKKKIRNIFPDKGATAILADKTGIAVFYASSMPVPTGVDELKRIQINLNVKEWSVD
ncbi:hypothetical protein [Porcipelethomonas sp.]|uniref:hypothetical protein n=1 Tax=Porcipelethomonas sp. TaxID=2981675 RepID=UPI003EFADFDE